LQDQKYARLSISKIEERRQRIIFFLSKHTFILSERAPDEYSFIILKILGISRAGDGFIRGANQSPEPDRAYDLAEGGQSSRQGNFRGSTKVPKNKTRQNLGCPVVFASATQD